MNLIILGDILEHLSKNDAINVWTMLKFHAKFLWISLPIKVPDRNWSFGYRQPQKEWAANSNEKHQYDWNYNELIKELGPFLWTAPFKIVGIFIAEENLSQ